MRTALVLCGVVAFGIYLARRVAMGNHKVPVFIHYVGGFMDGETEEVADWVVSTLVPSRKHSCIAYLYEGTREHNGDRIDCYLKLVSKIDWRKQSERRPPVAEASCDLPIYHKHNAE